MPKVLIVDDEEGIRLIGQRTLESMGLEVLAANNAAQALAVFKAHEFSLVITDLRVPGQEGLSLVTDIRAQNPSQKILIISGGDLEADWFKEASEAVGNIHTLAKPFEIEALANLVKRILEDQP